MHTRTKLLIAGMTVVGLALAGTIPALGQDNEPPPRPSVDCPYHEETPMTDQDMDRWMGSADHDRMHASMGDGNHMMYRHGVGPEPMMGSSG